METAKAIHEEMVARGFERDRRDTASLRFIGHIVARGRPISVAVVFEDRHLTRVPKLYLLNRAAELPNAIAHIEAENRLCYVREEDLVLDPLKPRGSVALCLLKIAEVLDRVIHQDLSAEISREFPQHWTGDAVYVDLPPNFSGSAQLYQVRNSSDEPIFVVGENCRTLSRLALSAAEIYNCQQRAIPVDVLSVAKDLTFACGQRSPTTLEELLGWMQSIDSNSADRLLKLLSARWPSHLHFLISAPNATVGGNLELPLVLAKSIQWPQFLERVLSARKRKITLKKLSGIRIDEALVFGRNMNDQPNLRGKRIALAGIGTIGGFVGKFLAQSAAGTAGGQLLLIDNQTFQPGNVGRHFLGMTHIGKNKARAVQEELRRMLPDCEVGAFSGSVLERKADLREFDLVVDATGERALSDVLNKESVDARRDGKPVAPVLHVWLVGNGVAAQALLVDSPNRACFRCLRLEDSSEERFRLLRPDHPAILTPADCGQGAYFAYGVGGPAIAAGLAVQMCLDWTKGNPSPRFRTIRVVHNATFEVKDADVPPREKCPACGVA